MANNYYKKHKEKLRKEAWERYQNLLEEKKQWLKYSRSRY